MLALTKDEKKIDSDFPMAPNPCSSCGAKLMMAVLAHACTKGAPVCLAAQAHSSCTGASGTVLAEEQRADAMACNEHRRCHLHCY